MAIRQRVVREDGSLGCGVGASWVTRHAWSRMTARRIPAQGVRFAFEDGRTAHVRGAAIHAIGRKEVERHRRNGLDLEPYEGIQVVCASDGTILTVYRNRDFRGLRD